jgi:Icc-related predicted phosphoesterase
MTRIAVLSDLHQEFTLADRQIASAQFFSPDPILDAVDVVVLAGDVHVPATRSLDWITRNFSDVPVVYVLGNHDYYQFPQAGGEGLQTYLEVLNRARERANQLGIHLLENDTVEIAGARFIGATLWTDFRLSFDPPMFERMRVARGREGMNDYRRIKRPSQKNPEQRRRMRPIDTIGLHIGTLNYVREVLRVPFAGPTVMVSHHAPHPNSLHSDCIGPLDHCYASDLSAILQQPEAPDLWVHGHIHKKSDYRVGKTRIVANPLGLRFTQDGYSRDFDPQLIVEL